MKKEKFEVIVCPNCGREYLPAEIYIPQAFFGNPWDVLRDDDRIKILSVAGTKMDLDEEYTCDKCNTTFKVKAKIQFDTSVTKTSNFDEEYSTSIHQDTITLSEDE